MTNNSINASYRGRFAPSPTGPLHFGSLVAAVTSYAQARTRQGKWLVRIEDVDLLRCDTASTALILKALEAYGMNWDEQIIYQSQRTDIYQYALDILSQKKLSYGCACSRKQINENITSSNKARIYPGTCRDGVAKDEAACSVRLRTSKQKICFEDILQGSYTQNIPVEVGDFIIKRTDGLFAYQLAVVVDDSEQQITEVVRGSDMLDSTPRQILLQRSLNYATPNYMHTPLVLNADGTKLSKQSKAVPINLEDPRPTLINALNFLCQHPPAELQDTDVETIWAWALEHWSVNAIPAKLGITYNETIWNNLLL